MASDKYLPIYNTGMDLAVYLEQIVSVLLFIGAFLLIPIAITWYLLRPNVKMFMEEN